MAPLWMVDPLDTVDASLWSEKSNIIVSESTDASPSYDYLLANLDDDEEVHARYVGTLWQLLTTGVVPLLSERQEKQS